MSKIYDFDEISKHNTKEDLWMVIDGKVYDCTAFLDEHPGGEEVMIDCGGIDATGPFDDIGHSEESREMLVDMLVGELDPACAPAETSSGASATTGGEQNMGLIIAIIVLILAVLAYLVLVK